jgi:hypothetical protein
MVTDGSLSVQEHRTAIHLELEALAAEEKELQNGESCEPDLDGDEALEVCTPLLISVPWIQLISGGAGAGGDGMGPQVPAGVTSIVTICKVSVKFEPIL